MNPQKYISLEELVKQRYVPHSTKGALYKALQRGRLLKSEFGFFQWGYKGVSKPVWVLDASYIEKLQSIFIHNGKQK